MRIQAIYHVRSEASAIAARAQGIAVEQSVEMPLSAVEDARVMAEIVGEVEDIADIGNGVFAVRIGLAAETVCSQAGGGDAGQLLNMLFGNTSLQDDVALRDMTLPPELTKKFHGPRHGLAGLRQRVRVTSGRALTCSALKPQGMPSDALAALAARLARGGLDYIKDDHGLADQAYSPFATRVRAITAALRVATAETGNPTRYIPSLSGDAGSMKSQVAVARAEGIDTVMLAPMVAGVSTMQSLVNAFPDMAFMAHPALGGVARIAPELLIGKLFPLFGADTVVFPTHGGRFGYSAQTCRDLAANARAIGHGSMPVPAGGIRLARTADILDFYGPETMLLMGGCLLDAKSRLTEETAAFTAAVAAHTYR
jgi:ribulose-bisphosphate carboxylase large chain